MAELQRDLQVGDSGWKNIQAVPSRLAMTFGYWLLGGLTVGDTSPSFHSCDCPLQLLSWRRVDCTA